MGDGEQRKENRLKFVLRQRRENVCEHIGSRELRKERRIQRASLKACISIYEGALFAAPDGFSL